MTPLYHEHIPTTSGIYRITCTVTGKIYIGSAVNLQARWRQHRNSLRHNTHHSITLQRAWNKYGEQAFTFEVLELVLPMSLTAREQYWFKKLKPFGKRGYNIASVAGSNLGRKASLATREKLRISHLGKKQGEETKRKLSDANKDKQFSAATREKIRLAKLGKKRSPEVVANLRSINIGRKHDPEVYAGRMKTLIVISPDGTEYIVHGIRKFCREHNLSISSLRQVALGKYSQHKGWIARFPDSI